MSFSGRVNKQSHNGGLLVSFEGKPPRLGANIRITGGRILGKVETVIGPIEDGLIHINPVWEDIDLQSAVGSPVEIAPRINSNRKNKRKIGNKRDSSERRGNSKYKSRGKSQTGYKKRRNSNNRRSNSSNRKGRNFKSNRNFKNKRRK